MNAIALTLGSRPVTWGEVALGAAALSLALLLLVTVLLLKARRERAVEALIAAERAVWVPLIRDLGITLD